MSRRFLMIRPLFAAIALFGLVAGAFADPVPLASGEIDRVVTLPDGQAKIKLGSGQTGAAERYDVSHMFDGIVAKNNFYSMGKGGVVQIDLNNPAVFSDDATLIEVTWNNGGEGSHKEAAEVWWGNEEGISEFAGVMVNFAADEDDLIGYTNDNIVAPFFDGVDLMKWQASLPAEGDYSTLYIRDVTSSAFSSGSSFDGFDIGEISYAATSVPEPTTVTLLGLSMLSLFGVAIRRKK